MLQSHKILAASCLTLVKSLKIDNIPNELMTELAELSEEQVNCQIYHERLKY